MGKMSAPSLRNRNRWWRVIGYEVWMFGIMAKIPRDHPLRSNAPFNNSITENVVLHTRNLCDFCTSSRDDDIKPDDLFDGYASDRRYERLRRLMRRLDKKYGKGGKGSARWAFNKKLAHPTKARGTSFEYTRYLNRVDPTLQEIISEMKRLRGRPF